MISVQLKEMADTTILHVTAKDVAYILTMQPGQFLRDIWNVLIDIIQQSGRDRTCAHARVNVQYTCSRACSRIPALYSNHRASKESCSYYISPSTHDVNMFTFHFYYSCSTRGISKMVSIATVTSYHHPQYRLCRDMSIARSVIIVAWKQISHTINITRGYPYRKAFLSGTASFRMKVVSGVTVPIPGSRSNSSWMGE